MKTKRSWFVPIILALVVVCVPVTAFATVRGRIYEGKGIKAARLGMKDSRAAKKIGGKRHFHVDNDYDFPVWFYTWGAKSKTGNYPVEMYSKGSHKVFEFVINCTTLKTKNGTHVGTAESTLVKRYGSRLTKNAGPVYADYHMGGSSGRTDFYVRGGKVRQIVITRY